MRISITIDSSQAGGQTFHTVHDSSTGVVVAEYTFANGYMIIAPTRALLMDALRVHPTGDSLGRSASFKALLPVDQNENYSAVAYQNLGPVLTPLLSQMSGESADALKKLASDSHPTAICAWGKDAGIEAASNSNLFGFDFLTLGRLLHSEQQTRCCRSRNKCSEQHVREDMGVIELDRLEVRLGGRTVLNGLTGELRGHAIGLLGPNGAGKSTLINTLLGFHEPVRRRRPGASASMRVCDRMRIRQSVGYMPENDSFIGNMSGVRFVRYMAELAGPASGEALERAHEALFYVGLGEVRYRKISTYSLGMKQLIKLAQGLAHGPKLLILDEPTNGLDPTARQRMIQTHQGHSQTGQHPSADLVAPAARYR